jgi:hypothetical protein
MKKKIAETKQRGGKRAGAGRPRANSGGLTVRVSVAMPPDVYARMEVGRKQIGCGRSRLVVAAVESILSQTPDRLRDAVAGRG